jgi:amino acid efflux transporter
LKNSRYGRIAAWTSLIVTGGLYPFLGWSALYPLVIAGVLLIWENWQRKAS